MRLESARVKNFKLLDDVEFDFSTDPSRPMTVIRAENGTGKTSILHALRWALYGERGIPSNMRLTSTAVPPNQAVTVEVRVQFATADPSSGMETRYRLIRSVEETPNVGDEFTRTGERERLLQLTDKGEAEITEGREGAIANMLPFNLADIFFTNGDDVQRFIARGPQRDKARQDAVHKAIRQLLGLESVETAESRLKSVHRQFRKDLVNVGGQDLRSSQAALDKVTDAIEQEIAKQETINQRIANIDEQIRIDERELDGIKGIGDLQTVQNKIKELERDIGDLETEEIDIRKQIKGLLSSQEFSWSIMGDRLVAGINGLNSLANRNVIPGHSVEVLIDRMKLGVCICGESLKLGHPRYDHITNLIDEQRDVEPRTQRLTSLWHEARNMQAAMESESREARSLTDRIRGLELRFTRCKDRQVIKNRDLRLQRDKRGEIDEERIQHLTARITSNRSKRSGFDQQLGASQGAMERHQIDEQDCRKRVEAAEKRADLSKSLQQRTDVVSDLLELTQETLNRLKTSYIERVSMRMNDYFLNIVGADADRDVHVFKAVRIDHKNHDIQIDSFEGRTLDAETELHGAAQRALTLSFIWALMEVAEREAPRIIDTPLGMTSGAFKRRMVEMISKPTRREMTPYQTVLFMTRSEIRDLENVVKERAGIVRTLTCSKDYPRDLVNDWGDGSTKSRICECNHLEFCYVCERQNDASADGLTERKVFEGDNRT